MIRLLELFWEQKSNLFLFQMINRVGLVIVIVYILIIQFDYPGGLWMTMISLSVEPILYDIDNYMNIHDLSVVFTVTAILLLFFPYILYILGY